LVHMQLKKHLGTHAIEETPWYTCNWRNTLVHIQL